MAGSSGRKNTWATLQQFNRRRRGLVSATNPTTRFDHAVFSLEGEATVATATGTSSIVDRRPWSGAPIGGSEEHTDEQGSESCRLALADVVAADRRRNGSRLLVFVPNSGARRCLSVSPCSPSPRKAARCPQLRRRLQASPGEALGAAPCCSSASTSRRLSAPLPSSSIRRRWVLPRPRSRLTFGNRDLFARTGTVLLVYVAAAAADVAEASLSPDASSRDLPLDSGTRKVQIRPRRLHAASRNSELRTPMPAA
ncbi:hypothetical protein EJB05_47590, partial [Eragrostis curvula]